MHSRKWRSKLSVVIHHDCFFIVNGRISNKELYVELVRYRSQKLPTVPETLLKRRKKLDEVRKARAFARNATVKVRVVACM